MDAGREGYKGGIQDDYHHNTEYALWLNGEESREVGVDTTSYGYVAPFSQLSELNQRRVAEIIAAKGQRIVEAANIGDFVHQHNIPVAGVERTVQTAQSAH